jgi:ferredoxin
MSAARHRVESAGYAPLELPDGAELSRTLTVQNSPVLFGCRTGLCGTCLVSVAVVDGGLAPPSVEELELLEVICPEREDARLACQLRLTADIRIEPIREG